MNKIPITPKQKEMEKQRILDNLVYSYDQQPGESTKAFKLFSSYLIMGRTRNLSKLFRRCNIKYHVIRDYAKKYNWKIRAADKDFDEDEEMRLLLDSEILQSRIRQQQIAKSMSELAERGLEMLSDNVDDLSPQDCARLLDVGSKIENLALGKSTEIFESDIKSEVKIQVEEVPKEIAEEIGKLLAIKASTAMEINV